MRAVHSDVAIAAGIVAFCAAVYAVTTTISRACPHARHGHGAGGISASPPRGDGGSGAGCWSGRRAAAPTRCARRFRPWSISRLPAIFALHGAAWLTGLAAGRLPRHRRLRALWGERRWALLVGKRRHPERAHLPAVRQGLRRAAAARRHRRLAASESTAMDAFCGRHGHPLDPYMLDGDPGRHGARRRRRRPARPQRQHDGGAAAAADHRHGADRRASPSSAPSIAPPISAARSRPSSSTRRAIPPPRRRPMTAIRWRRAARPGAPSACRRSPAPSAAFSA